ncbi:phosphate ABC transporter substrate-binding/OmpA family protein [Fischerella sp. PCC 9605]|uniref:phosphate ABC transporter substrate-binding/OmpA family protein n=1 Tax=Fischerella sp. PCC 9605 TaxID=1173024 RepID=UPI00047C383F|nr:phosphate ABC transporter substrate-binding/OmpA family protein [Fischerella sp. PCC 9605]
MKQKDNLIAIVLVMAVVLSSVPFISTWLLEQFFPPIIITKENSKAETINKLIVSGNDFSGYSTFRSQAFQKGLKEAGLDNVRYEEELDFGKLAEKLNRGEANFILTTLDQFLVHNTQGKIVGLVDTTVGADAVVLNTKKYPNLKSLVDLPQLIQQANAKGQQLSITFAGDTPSEYLAMVLSSKFEAFKLSDFQIKKVADAGEAWKLLEDPNENVAVAVLWEPYISQARQQGHTVVLSSKDAPGIIIDIIVASNRLLQSQPWVVEQFLSAYYRETEANIHDAKRLQAQITETSNLPTNDAVTVMQGIDFFTSVEAQKWLTDGTLNRRIRSTAAVLTLAGKLNQVPFNSKALYTPELIAQAAQNTKNLIEEVRPDNPALAKKLEGEASASITTVNPSQIATAPSIGNLQLKGEVKFATDSALLTDKGQQTLNRLAQEIAEFNEQTVALRVIGHTSRTGDAAANQKLSQARAEQVRNYLRKRGLKHNIIAVGKGFTQPLPGFVADDPRNQRTEIRLVRVN